MADFWTWLTTPTVHPFAGIVAALAAALTIRPLSWLNPFRAVRRIAQVAILWCVAVWMLGMTPGPDGDTTWLIRPYLGAAAAVLAAVTVRLLTWFNPLRAARRVVQVSAVWLLVAWLVVMSNGEGFGFGGRGQGGSGTSTGAGPGDAPGEWRSRPGVTIVSGEFPRGLSPNVVVQVRFVPLATDPAVARDFACDVLVRTDGRIAEIRTATMGQFLAELRQVLGDVAVPRNVREPLASVRGKPYPGDGVLRKVEAVLHETQPRLGLQREQYP